LVVLPHVSVSCTHIVLKDENWTLQNMHAGSTADVLGEAPPPRRWTSKPFDSLWQPTFDTLRPTTMSYLFRESKEGKRVVACKAFWQTC
jgi:hypothetical protein